MSKVRQTIGLISFVLFAYFLTQDQCVAWMSFLIFGIVLLFHTPEYCLFWGDNIGKIHDPNHPPPHIKYYGNAATISECQALCDQDPDCKSFTYPVTSDSKDPWYQHCYGKTTNEVEVAQNKPNMISGLKVQDFLELKD